MFVLIGLLTGTFSVFGPVSDAAPVSSGVIGNFEIDGDQSSPAGGTLDWGDVASSPTLSVLTDAVGPDDGLQGSSKEDEPEGFACQDKDPTVTPGKDNLVRAYINARVQSASSIFLDLGFVRSDGGTQGDSHVNFEFNQNPVTDTCPYVGRSDGDLLIVFDFPGNAADPADVQTFTWDDDAPDGSDNPGKWVPFTFTGSVAAEDNIAEITDEVVGGTVAARAFGEASIDLVALAQQTGGGSQDCLSFGFASIRSRSSGQSFSSALQDIMGGPVDVSTCGKIVVQKTDDAGTALAGATFGLWPAPSTVPAVVGGTRPSTGSIDTCVSIANGTCTFSSVDPGSYKVAEISPPSGYDIDPDVVDVTVGFRQTVTVQAPFVDPRDAGSVTITKRIWDDKNANGLVDSGEILDLKVASGVVYHDINHNGIKEAAEPAIDLTGVTFALQQGGVTATTWPGGTAAQCTIPAGSLSCTVGPVLLGSYTIVETVDPAKPLPAGVGIGPNVAVNVTQDDQTVQATYTNPVSPLNIDLQKSGPDTAHIGQTFTYTFNVSTTGPRLHDVTVVELIPDKCNSGALTGPNKSTSIDPDNDADAYLELGEVWQWTCSHLVTAADGSTIHNEARATGTDDLGRQVSDEDPHDVIVLYPDLQVVKLAADGVDANGSASADETIDAPGTASYTVTVTNVGAGIARNATLTDTLPPGSWNVSLASPDGDDVCPVGGSPKSGSFSCTFGDLAAGASKVITVSRAVTIAADCAAVLVNNAGVTTTYLQADIDPNSANDSSSATIRVRCPDVGVVKSASNSPISAGQRAEWTITLTNNGPGVATGVFLVDSIPAGLTAPQVGGANAASCSLVGNAVTCSFGDVAPNDGAPGGPDTRVITVSGLTDQADCATIPNTATVASTSLGAPYVDSNPNNNSSTASVVVQCPDVYVDKSGPAEVSAGDTITWSITFGNNGPGDAFDAVLTDVLPAGLTGYQLTDPDSVCDLASGTVTCTFSVLEAGDAYAISVTGTTGTSAQACGNVVNPASISASNEAVGTVRDNNFDSVTTDVECPDVDLEKVADDPSTVSAGDPVGFTISVANAAGEDIGIARDVVVTDTLPDIPGYTWSFDDVVSAEEDPCSLVGRALTCDFGDLSPGESASVHVYATQDGVADPEAACGTYPNTGTVALSNGTEADQTDNSDSVTILCPGVNLGKVADDELVEAGDEIGFTITVSNIDDGEPPTEGVAHDVVVVDELPGDLAWTVAADSDLPEGATCDIDAGVLTCELGDLAAIDEADAPQVTIHVVADTTEADCTVYDNTASASVANGADPDDASASSRVRCPISIDLDKTGDTLAHVGDVVDYEFTVTNTGGEDLLDLVLTDPECDEGTISLIDDGDGDAVLSAGVWDAELEAFVDGEAWAYSCERTLTAADVVLIDGADFALNTGSVRGEDADGREVTDTDPHVVEIITPVIQVVKTVDDDTPAVGQTVTFTYVVTNTGDTTLFGVDVVDDQLGAIGTIPELAVGASATLTKTMVVAATSPTRNVATATGDDVLGKTVTDDDDATITVVLGEVIVRQPEALPRTGVDSDRLMLISGLFLLFGGLLLASSEGWALRTVRRRQG